MVVHKRRADEKALLARLIDPEKADRGIALRVQVTELVDPSSTGDKP
jgi:hypothetical protein